MTRKCIGFIKYCVGHEESYIEGKDGMIQGIDTYILLASTGRTC